MDSKKGTVIINTELMCRSNVQISEEYNYITLKQVILTIEEYRGLLMIDIGSKLKSKIYFELLNGPCVWNSIIKTIFVEERVTKLDFSSKMEFHPLEDSIPWIDVACIDSGGREIQFGGIFVFELT